MWSIICSFLIFSINGWNNIWLFCRIHDPNPLMVIIPSWSCSESFSLFPCTLFSAPAVHLYEGQVEKSVKVEVNYSEDSRTVNTWHSGYRKRVLHVNKSVYRFNLVKTLILYLMYMKSFHSIVTKNNVQIICQVFMVRVILL